METIEDLQPILLHVNIEKGAPRKFTPTQGLRGRSQAIERAKCFVLRLYDLRIATNPKSSLQEPCWVSHCHLHGALEGESFAMGLTALKPNQVFSTAITDAASRNDRPVRSLTSPHAYKHYSQDAVASRYLAVRRRSSRPLIPI
jgi:hypothetical protein